jgi:hypothetical protein
MAEKPQPEPADQPLTSKVRTSPSVASPASPPAGEIPSGGSTGQSGQGRRRGVGGIGVTPGDSPGIRMPLSGPTLGPTLGMKPGDTS